MIAVNPKLEFKLRSLQNWAWCIGGFAVWVLVFSPFPFRWLADLAGIAIAYYVLFYVLDKRALSITCPNCNKQVATNTPWVCGICTKNNLRVEDYPFTNKCEHCGAEPKAYKCHHANCGKLIFFSEDRQEENFAYCLNPKAQAPPPDKRVERTEQKEEKNHELELEKLDAELEEIRRLRKLRNKEEPSLDEATQKSLDKTYSKFMSVQAHAKKKRAIADEEFKDDEDMRKKAHDVIDAWERDHTF